MTNDADEKENPNLPDVIAICKKNSAGKVHYQNMECQKICGERVGQTCTDNCMELYNKANIRQAKGTFQFKHVKIDNDDYDILMINDGESIVSILYNLSQKKAEDAHFFEQFNLTTSELKIVDLVSQGLSNKEISDLQFISTTTLKTHINNILKKIPKKYWPRHQIKS